MKQNNKTWLLIIAAAAITQSCSKDFLNKTPQSDYTTASFYKTANDAETALTGAYSGLHDQYYIWDYQINGDARADNAYAGGDNPDNFQIDNFQLTASNGNVTRDWQGIYNRILAANAVLDNIPKIEDPVWNGTDRKNQILAEAKFLRAFHYFHLVTTWGEVPLVLSSTDQDIFKSRSSVADVYAQIEKDLLEAETVLPKTFDSDAQTRGRATQGGAEALLAKVYAQEGKYQECLDYCDKVINNGNYTLLGDYAQLFDGAHANNSESIFEIQYNDAGAGDWGIQLLTPPSLTGDDWIKFNTPSHDLLKAFDAANDVVRKGVSIIVEKANPPAQYVADPNNVPFIGKWRHPNGWNSPDNVMMIRLADIILLKAEALNQLGRTDEAIPLVDQIRQRVSLGKTTATTQDEVKLAILNERRLELAFEGERWNDLLRAGTDYTVQVMNSQKDGAGNNLNYNVTADKLIFPIPQQDRDLNKNLTQNPGY